MPPVRVLVLLAGIAHAVRPEKATKHSGERKLAKRRFSGTPASLLDTTAAKEANWTKSPLNKVCRETTTCAPGKDGPGSDQCRDYECTSCGSKLCKSIEDAMICCKAHPRCTAVYGGGTDWWMFNAQCDETYHVNNYKVWHRPDAPAIASEEGCPPRCQIHNNRLFRGMCSSTCKERCDFCSKTEPSRRKRTMQQGCRRHCRIFNNRLGRGRCTSHCKKDCDFCKKDEQTPAEPAEQGCPTLCKTFNNRLMRNRCPAKCKPACDFCNPVKETEKSPAPAPKPKSKCAFHCKIFKRKPRWCSRRCKATCDYCKAR